MPPRSSCPGIDCFDDSLFFGASFASLQPEAQKLAGRISREAMAKTEELSRAPSDGTKKKNESENEKDAATMGVVDEAKLAGVSLLAELRAARPSSSCYPSKAHRVLGVGEQDYELAAAAAAAAAEPSAGAPTEREAAAAAAASAERGRRGDGDDAGPSPSLAALFDLAEGLAEALYGAAAKVRRVLGKKYPSDPPPERRGSDDEQDAARRPSPLLITSPPSSSSSSSSCSAKAPARHISSDISGERNDSDEGPTTKPQSNGDDNARGDAMIVPQSQWAERASQGSIRTLQTDANPVDFRPYSAGSRASSAASYRLRKKREHRRRLVRLAATAAAGAALGLLLVGVGHWKGETVGPMVAPMAPPVVPLVVGMYVPMPLGADVSDVARGEAKAGGSKKKKKTTKKKAMMALMTAARGGALSAVAWARDDRSVASSSSPAGVATGASGARHLSPSLEGMASGGEGAAGAAEMEEAAKVDEAAKADAAAWKALQRRAAARPGQGRDADSSARQDEAAASDSTEGGAGRSKRKLKLPFFFSSSSDDSSRAVSDPNAEKEGRPKNENGAVDLPTKLRMHKMGGVFAAINPPQDSINFEMNWGKVRYLGMGAGDGF